MTSKIENLDQLETILGTAFDLLLKKALNDKHKFNCRKNEPAVFTIVSGSNGASFFRGHEDDATIVHKFREGVGVELPAHIVFIDNRGHSMSMVIESSALN